MKLPLIFSLFLATVVAKIFIVETDDQNAEKKRHEMEGEKVYIPRKVLLRTFTDICNHFKHRGHRQDPKCKVRHLIAMEASAGEDHLRLVDLTNAGARL